MKNIILSVLILYPSLVLADYNKYQKQYEMEEKLRTAKSAIKSVESSPYIGIAAYGLGAIGVFVGLIVVVFVLIMFLRR